MFINSNYITFNNNLSIYNFHYNNIRTKFINYYLKFIDNNHQKAIIYSKYYLYFTIYNCIYNQNIMNIINQVNFYISNF